MIVTTIQLTGSLSGYLDVEDSKAVPVIFSSSDIRDISKKSGNTSRSITLSNTKNNHNLLGFYFDVNIQAGTFNINKLTTCILLQNGVPILDNAVLQLISVKKNGTNNNLTDVVTYEVVIKDSTADFFTKLGSKELSDLDFSEYNHTYNLSNVIDSFGNTIEQGYKYILPYGPDNNYNLEEFKPAIYAKKYFDRIFSTNGFTYVWEGLDDINTRFDKLIIPFNGDEKQITGKNIEEYNIEAKKTSEEEFVNSSGHSDITFKKIEVSTEIKDINNIYDSVNSVYVNPFKIKTPNSVKYEISVEWEFVMYNRETVNVFLATGILQYLPVLEVKNSAPFLKYSDNKILTEAVRSDVVSFSSSSFYLSAMVANSFSPGKTIVAKGIFSKEFSINNLEVGEQLSLGIRCEVLGQEGPAWYKTGTVEYANISPLLRVKNVELKIIQNIESIGYSMPVNLNQYIPLKVKQSDFMKSIFTLYNLYTEVDSFNPKKLILKKRNDYYDGGNAKDWTFKKDKSKDSIITFLPSLQNKKTILTYKQDEDTPNKGYFENTGEVYGQVEYVYENEYVKDIDRKELIFSPTPVTETTFKAVVPILNGRTPKTNIRLLYDGGVNDCDNYTILEYTGATPTVLNNYPLTSHFDKEYNPTFDINFAVCDYYFYSTLGTNTSNNMYNLNWRRTFSQINNGKMLTAYFNLNELDINTLKLSDRIFIENSWWNINKLEYNANSKDTTRVELISVDSEQYLGEFKTKTKKVTDTGGNVFERVKEMAKGIFRVNNINKSFYPIDVIGKNNTIEETVKGGAIYGNSNLVTAEKALVIGDGFTVDASGIYSERFVLPNGEMLDESNVGNLATKDLTLTAYRNIDLNEYGMNFHNGNVLFDALGLDIYTVKMKGQTTNPDKATLILNNINEAGQSLLIDGGIMRFTFIPTYANEAAAQVAGLETGTIYKTSTGEVRIKLEPTA
jgi:hypothetical protein